MENPEVQASADNLAAVQAALGKLKVQYGEVQINILPYRPLCSSNRMEIPVVAGEVLDTAKSADIEAALQASADHVVNLVAIFK